MALQLKQLVQVSQDGGFIWSTDQTGEYNINDNEGGWGSPNFELNQSALMVINRRDSIPTEYTGFVDAQIKYSIGYTNDSIITWEMPYINDGVYSSYLIRLYASADDVISVDGYTFVNGDVWYNTISRVVKQLVDGVAEILALALDEDVEKIIAADNVTFTLCENILTNKLAIEKNNISLNLFRDRIKGTCDTQSEAIKIKNQMDILLSIASAHYSFSFGLKQEAQRIVETSLENYNITQNV